MESLPELLQTFGLPVGLLIALLAALWRGCHWLASEILRPVTARHLQFLDAVDVALKQMNDNVGHLTRSVETVAAEQRNIRELIDERSIHPTTSQEDHDEPNRSRAAAAAERAGSRR